MSAKPRFKVGQDIWFRYKQNRPAPISVLGYGKKPIFGLSPLFGHRRGKTLFLVFLKQEDL